jgi:transketolase
VRDIFCRTLVSHATNRNLVFLTGDLGFKALEPLRDALGTRFINAGVAEQNMISVAAGLAKLGLRPWAYSIAPFIYARPFEQIRNDICLHALPVVLVGNGGGYGYGVMGGTHHALEDYGCLLTLPGMRVFVPAFDEDVAAMIPLLINTRTPAYLRLGVSELPVGWGPPIYSGWRRLLQGKGLTLVAIGPLVGGLLAAASQLPEAARPDLWLVSELPMAAIPQDFVESVRRSGHLLVVEEHTSAGGIAQMLAYRLASMGESPKRFSHRYAHGSSSAGRYGSQRFHRLQNGLDPSSILDSIASE